MSIIKSSKHNYKLAEGIIWDNRAELLLFVDILSKKLFRVEIDSFEIVTEYQFDEYIGWVQLTNNPDLYLIGLKSGIAVLDTKTLIIKFINKEIPHCATQRLNDSFVDPSGGLWYGTMDLELNHLYNGVLARYSSKDGKPMILDGGYGIPNGPIIDNNNIFHTDSQKGVVYKLKFDNKINEIVEKNIFLQFDPEFGVPDGMCFNNKGNLFIAIWGGWAVNEYTQSGEFIGAYELPEKYITNICFAGKSLDRLFVTTAKSNDSEDSNGKGGYIYEILNHNRKGLLSNNFFLF